MQNASLQNWVKPMSEFDDPLPKEEPHLAERIVNLRNEAHGSLNDPQASEREKAIAKRALGAAYALEKVPRVKVPRKPPDTVSPKESGPPPQRTSEAATEKTQNKKETQPTETVYESAGYSLCIATGVVGAVPFCKRTWEPHQTVQECIEKSRIAPACYSTHRLIHSEDLNTWVRHSEDEVEEKFNFGRKRLVLAKTILHPDFKSVCEFLTGYFPELSLPKQNDISELISAGELRLKDWPPSVERPVGCYVSFEVFEVFEVYSEHQEPIEGAEWIIKDKYYLKPWGLGNSGYTVNGPGLVVEHAETRQDAKRLVSEFLNTDVSPYQRHEDRANRWFGRIVWIVLVLVFLSAYLS